MLGGVDLSGTVVESADERFRKGDAVIADRLNHASLMDAAKLSRARLFVYDHGSAASLEKVLTRTKSYRKRVIATDSLFSMDGDLAPLLELLFRCKLA